MSKAAEPAREVVQTLCRMCDDHCGINVYLANGQVVDIDGLSTHPWNQGRLCSKGRAAVDMVYSPERLTKPLKKTADGWEEIDLETALDEIAEKMRRIKAEYGPRSMSIWKGEALGFAQEEDMARRFCHAFGTPNYFSNDSQCFNGRFIGYKLVEGIWPIPDFVNSRCIVLWGTNPPAAHPHMTRMILEGRSRGAQLIVVDPRLSAIARQADIHAALKPGTDGALAWGIIHLLIANKWYSQDFVDAYTVGFAEMARYAARFTPAYVEGETGVPEATLRGIAAAIRRAGTRVANYVGNGPEHHENGINNIRAMACLDALTGSLDEIGGNLMAEPMGLRDLTLYEEIPLRHLEPIGADRFPVLYDFRQECHTMTAMNVILSADPYPLKGMIITGANPAMTNPNTAKVVQALQSLELLVVRDLFMTETAALADYVLPAASFLERSELHCHMMFQIITLSKKILSFPHCQDEYQFWHSLAHRLEIGSYFPWPDETELNRWLLEPTGVSLEQVAACPQGYTFKPRRYRKWQFKKFNTPSGKVEFTSAYLKNLGYPELPEYQPPTYLTQADPDYPFVLITGARNVLFYHSRNHNIPRFNTPKFMPEVEMHPEDAEKLQLADGDRVVITSRIGSLEIRAKIMAENEIRPGNLQITHGWKKANVNRITHDDIFDPIDGFPLMKAVQVRVEKCPAPL